MSKFTVYSLALGSLLLLTNCGDPAQVINTTTETERIPVELTEDDLFTGNKILAFLENEEKYLQEANEFFLKGLNSFRNEKDLDSADYYFKKSILKEPTAKAYFELGNVYFDRKKYDDAIMAYGLAERLDYEPFSKILYNKACIYSLKEDKEMSSRYLEYALQAGYNNLDHIDKDSDLDYLRDQWGFHYRQAIDRGLRGVSDADNLFWLQFKKLFAVTKLPMELQMTLDDKMSESLEYISYDYEKYIAEMRDEKFSREVSKGFYYHSRPYETKDFVAVIYIVKEEFLGEAAPLTYKLATFTHEGKLIDKKVIAGRELYSDPVMVSTLNKNRTIDTKMVEPVYEKDPDEHGYYENKVVSTEEVGSTSFRIDHKGKIIEEDGLAMN